jgi:ABC-type bacteriocin/lantibiotic exporter with double-glycine peptidase domain
MPKNELERLKQKHTENIRQAYANIVKSDSKDRQNELEIILDYFGIDCGANGRLTENDSFANRLDELKSRYDINYRTVRLSDGWYKNSSLPLIVRRDDILKAVLPDFRGRCYIYLDGKRQYISDTTRFTEDAICFYRGFGNGRVSKRCLIKYMLSCISPWEYLTVVVAMVAVMLFSTVMPQAEYYIFNNVIPSGTRGDIVTVGALLFGIITISLAVYLVKSFVTSSIPLEISTHLQGAVAARLLKLKIGFFGEQKAGRLSSDLLTLSDISSIFSGEVISALMSFVLSVIYAVRIAYYTSEFMAYVYITFAVVLVLVSVRTVFANRYGTRLAQKQSDMTGFVYELFGGMENIKLNNAEAVMLKRWSGCYADTLRAEKKPFIVKSYDAVYTLAVSLLTLAIFKTGIGTGTDTAHFIVFMSLYGLFIGSVGGIATVLNAVSSFNSAYNSLSEFFNAEVEESSEKQHLKEFDGGVEFFKVSYKYPDCNDNVLNGISFSLKKGQKIGITGKSGCGKSTLLKLLLGFEKPDKGRIFIGNTDLNEISLSDYRKRLGVVLQSSRLIAADIFSNITLTYPQATLDEVNAVVEIVGLKNDIEKMPMGLHTFVSDDNLTISVGQKQRILLARAIIAKPALLVLDEATNALDNLTQAAITSYVANTDTTAVIVAHRLSTIKQCDNIIVLGDGTVKEEGNYDELIEKRGAFYDLVKQQVL